MCRYGPSLCFKDGFKQFTLSKGDSCPTFPDCSEKNLLFSLPPDLCSGGNSLQTRFPGKHAGVLGHSVQSVNPGQSDGAPSEVQDSENGQKDQQREKESQGEVKKERCILGARSPAAWGHLRDWRLNYPAAPAARWIRRTRGEDERS
ncbi:Hypothetical predicted protein [Xyrichtys novacula]|uniref:Uncharacterized protein n=1 Tax=Xyrichtys novacula TaxID=13765 RepID=A0AAV1G445_XYRNO|nr:Hypothetical predicted protein [Xyrichtys novacula]